ncbi:MAG: isoprenylcysteine carboxylmethyltransferase family protein [archaeon]|nr:isoprenylcysteine carboxylmethyltransferase family protein [archaeon]
MSLIPTFELGLWNAWILVISMIIIFFFDVRATVARESGDFQLAKKEKRILNAIPLTIIVSFVYAVFLPLQLGTTWLYSGLLIYLFGIILTAVAVLDFASAPKNRLVTKGLYRVTRNPVYVGMLLMQIGIVVTCTSWLYLLLTVVLLILLNAILSAEERYCLYRYGDDYQKYMNKTPRWMGIPRARENNRED